MSAGPLHAYLSGTGKDDRNRGIEEVLAFPDETLEHVHDYIQWLFPLPTRSSAQPSAPVLTPDQIAAIRLDENAQTNLRRAAERMLAFYDATRWWLAWSDHNHLRITRILQSLRLLSGQDAAQSFYDAILARHRTAGSPINPHNLRYWANAMDSPQPDNR
jgi:Opioid growth factor receptor (OGFr) conserved region